MLSKFTIITILVLIGFTWCRNVATPSDSDTDDVNGPNKPIGSNGNGGKPNRPGNSSENGGSGTNNGSGGKPNRPANSTRNGGKPNKPIGSNGNGGKPNRLGNSSGNGGSGTNNGNGGRPNRPANSTGNCGRPNRPGDSSSDGNNEDNQIAALDRHRKDIYMMNRKVRSKTSVNLRPVLKSIMTTQRINKVKGLKKRLNKIKIDQTIKKQLNKINVCKGKKLKNEVNVDKCLTKIMDIIMKAPKMPQENNDKPGAQNGSGKKSGNGGKNPRKKGNRQSNNQ